MLQDESLHVINDSSDDGWSIVQTPGFGNKPSLVPATFPERLLLDSAIFALFGS